MSALHGRRLIVVEIYLKGSVRLSVAGGRGATAPQGITLHFVILYRRDRNRTVGVALDAAEEEAIFDTA